MAMRPIKEWCDDALRVVFPLVCEVCGRSLSRGENTICMHCKMEMPRTRLHLEDFNTIHQRLAGKAPIDKAGGYIYYYRDSDFARMIQRAKYNNRPSIMAQLTACYVAEILDDGFFEGIDYVQPVPMHWFKKICRGYNQSEVVARAINKAIGIKQCNCLTKVRQRGTQTRKGRFARWLNTRNAYKTKNIDVLRDKHVLLVDDVITTGATMLACCEAIHKESPTTRISVLSLGVTHLQ